MDVYAYGNPYGKFLFNECICIYTHFIVMISSKLSKKHVSLSLCIVHLISAALFKAGNQFMATSFPVLGF